MRSGMRGNSHVPFWRAAALVRESLTLIKSGIEIVDKSDLNLTKEILAVLAKMPTL